MNAFKSRKIAIRARYFDEFCTDYTSRSTKQLISLGAGMDTRAFRLPLPSSSRFFEVDHPSVIAYKDSIIQLHNITSICRRITIGCDLCETERWMDQLVGSSYAPSLPSCWLLEGLSMYLSPDTLTAILRTIDASSCAGSSLCMSYVNTAVLRSAQSSEASALQAWKWGCDDIHAFFRDALGPSWRVRAVAVHGREGGYPYGANFGAIPATNSEAPSYTVVDKLI